MSGFMWKATVRNVRRAFKEVNAFEWEGDYRPAAREALKRILEDKVDKEVEQYLGRGWYERRGEGRSGGLSEWFSYSASADGDRGFSGSDASDTEEICFQGIGGLSEAGADGGSVDFGVFCVGDEYAEGLDGLSFIIRGESVSHDSE